MTAEVQIDDDDWGLAWACFHTPPRQAESFDAWVARVRAEQLLHSIPECQLFDEQGSGCGLKPKAV